MYPSSLETTPRGTVNYTNTKRLLLNFREGKPDVGAAESLCGKAVAHTPTKSSIGLKGGGEGGGKGSLLTSQTL